MQKMYSTRDIIEKNTIYTIIMAHTSYQKTNRGYCCILLCQVTENTIRSTHFVWFWLRDKIRSDEFSRQPACWAHQLYEQLWNIYTIRCRIIKFSYEWTGGTMAPHSLVSHIIHLPVHRGHLYEVRKADTICGDSHGWVWRSKVNRL